MIITEFDPINVPEDRAREQLPIHLVQRGHPAWPGAVLEIFFDYNNSGEWWTWKVDLEGYGQIIPRQPVDYLKFYSFEDYILFGFIDLSGDTERVTPNTLGAEITLLAFPGLNSPGYDEWLARQRTTDEEAEKLLAAWSNRVVE